MGARQGTKQALEDPTQVGAELNALKQELEKLRASEQELKAKLKEKTGPASMRARAAAEEEAMEQYLAENGGMTRTTLTNDAYHHHRNIHPHKRMRTHMHTHTRTHTPKPA